MAVRVVINTIPFDFVNIFSVLRMKQTYIMHKHGANKFIVQKGAKSLNHLMYGHYAVQ
jgi:hypothetical protein